MRFKFIRAILIAYTFLFTGTINAQISYDICIPTAWIGGGSAELTIFNNTGSALPPGTTFEFNWPGITSISPWGGFTVTGTNPFILTTTSPVAAGSITNFNFGFSSSGSYFLPPNAILNDTSNTDLVSPPCYVPPSYNNFDYEIEFSELCFHETETAGAIGEIRIGTGTIESWNSNLDLYIPNNRKKWAVGMAVAHTLFSNLVGFDLMSINEFFATGIQETNCGCDGGINEPTWVTNPYPDHENNNPVFCYDYTHGVANGFFQEEYGTGWLELDQDIPCFIPTFNYDSTIVGKNFSAQLIGKVYHDYNNLMFLEYIKCYEVLDFLKNCADPYGPEKFVAAAYNRGMNAGFIESILVLNRATTINAPDLLNHIPGLGQQYAEQISRTTAVLDNNMGAVSNFGTSTYSVNWPGNHQHLGFYDEPISWTIIDNYLNDLIPMFSGVGVNMNDVKTEVQAVFNSINGGSTISFRYDLGSVVDAIVLNLPAFEPMFGLGQVYGNSGGSSCNKPTARLEESQNICEGDTAFLEVYLTGTAPWSFTYNQNGTDITVNNVNSSPYVLPVTDTGVYILSLVTDGSNSIGGVICEPLYITYSDSSTVQFNAINAASCTTDSLVIELTGSAPWNITYTDPNGSLNTINSIHNSPYYITQNVTQGNYVLNTLEFGNCLVNVNDTLNILNGNSPNITTQLSDSILCSGDTATLNIDFIGSSPFSIIYELNGNIISEANINNTLALNFTSNSSINFLEVIDANCNQSLSIYYQITIHQNPIINLGNDTTICPGENITLNGLNGHSNYWSTLDTNTNINVTTQGIYSLVVTDLNGCYSSDSITLTYMDTLGANFSFTADSCSIDSIWINFTGQGPWNANYTDQFGANSSLSSIQNNPYLFSVLPDTVNITINLVSNDYCNQLLSENISINASFLPVIELSEDTIICDQNSFLIDPVIDQNNLLYNWNNQTTDSTLEVTMNGVYSVVDSN